MEKYYLFDSTLRAAGEGCFQHEKRFSNMWQSTWNSAFEPTTNASGFNSDKTPLRWSRGRLEPGLLLQMGRTFIIPTDRDEPFNRLFSPSAQGELNVSDSAGCLTPVTHEPACWCRHWKMPVGPKWSRCAINTPDLTLQLWESWVNLIDELNSPLRVEAEQAALYKDDPDRTKQEMKAKFIRQPDAVKTALFQRAGLVPATAQTATAKSNFITFSRACFGLSINCCSPLAMSCPITASLPCPLTSPFSFPLQFLSSASSAVTSFCLSQ